MLFDHIPHWLDCACDGLKWYHGGKQRSDVQVVISQTLIWNNALTIMFHQGCCAVLVNHLPISVFYMPPDVKNACLTNEMCWAEQRLIGSNFGKENSNGKSTLFGTLEANFCK